MQVEWGLFPLIWLQRKMESFRLESKYPLRHQNTRLPLVAYSCGNFRKHRFVPTRSQLIMPNVPQESADLDKIEVFCIKRQWRQTIQFFKDAKHGRMYAWMDTCMDGSLGEFCITFTQVRAFRQEANWAIGWKWQDSYAGPSNWQPSMLPPSQMLTTAWEMDGWMDWLDHET